MNKLHQIKEHREHQEVALSDSSLKGKKKEKEKKKKEKSEKEKEEKSRNTYAPHGHADAECLAREAHKDDGAHFGSLVRAIKQETSIKKEKLRV